MGAAPSSTPPAVGAHAGSTTAATGRPRSRLSRHATRMEARGLIRRAPDPADGRGCFLVLTEMGLDTLRQAAPTHVASVRRHFVDQLDPQELTVLSRVAAKLAGEPEDLL
ncbi:MarR family winged helix-turn-helix transcriptional regulator [Streptomyces sp. NPDC033538]|uniref:MarR family winged helix-turn-helix transcriptional regulator n=1 Tax=Streptomyces sp. NPDC033538 TaxID=3155367 RepID=UPI0033E7FE40